VDTNAQKPGAGGDCTFGEAIDSANGDADVDGCVGVGPYGDDIIELPTDTYILTDVEAAISGLPNVTDNLTVNGNGSTIMRDPAAPEFRIWTPGGGVSTITMVINDLTIQGGKPPPGNNGAGIFFNAIVNDDILELNRVTFTGNTANDQGGAFFNFFGTVEIRESTFWGNSNTGTNGGAILNIGTLTLTNSTISGNQTPENGGGIFNESGTISLNNVTITGNSADNDGDGTGDGGGIYNFQGNTFILRNSIIGGNMDHSPGAESPDCFNETGTPDGVLDSQGFNLIQNLNGCPTLSSDLTNIIGLDPRLGDLEDNGGPTLTHALFQESPAVDGGNPADCTESDGTTPLMVDQRGFFRPAGIACDVGAFESTCGDNITDTGEECDDGNILSTDGCTNICKIAVCGDGFIQTGTEECDDGNLLNGDACSDLCLIVAVANPEICGNGIDDDGDSRVDCTDPDCTADPLCNLFVMGGGCGLGSPGPTWGGSTLWPMLLIPLLIRKRRVSAKS
jgi:cysteine-rich repeat protein